MAIWIYNSLGRTKEEFQPLAPPHVGIYFCGPTVYADTHIGHLRPALTGDVMVRWLRYRGYQVRYLVNFTDIDDKIIRKAAETGLQPLEVSRRYIDQYLDIMERLGVDQVDDYPRVSEHIPDIVSMIERLIASGYAYTLDGSVYFSVERKEDYGKLSGRKLEDMLAGARVEIDESKYHPMDFALWKASRPGEPGWESPWGPGRPGWHIECSAMSTRYLGTTFDIHGGGDDLIFPHHENEIAQSEAALGEPFARYWVHNGMIQIDDEKMSKSLGNFITAEQILEQAPPEVVRLLLFNTHYRNPLNYSDRSLEEAGRAWERLRLAYVSLNDALELVFSRAEADAGLSYRTERESDESLSAMTAAASLAANCRLLRDRFEKSMDDDFHTAKALAVLFDLARETNRFLSRHIQAYAPAVLCDWPSATLEAVHEALQACKDLFLLGNRILGVIGRMQCADGVSSLEDREGGALQESLLRLLLDVRQDARSRKDWQTADRIRDGLTKLGVTIEDTPQGARWKIESYAGEGEV